MTPRRAAALMLAVTLLASCGERSVSPLLRAFGTSALGTLERATAGPAQDAAPRLSRAQADRAPGALILVSLEGGGPGDPMVAIAANAGRVTYANAARQTVTLEGARVVRAGGLGAALTNYASRPEEDALVAPRPLAEWPAEVLRVMRFIDAQNREFARTARCRPAERAAERIEIVERMFDVVRVEEHCATPSRTFANTYWVSAESGYVWRSAQWVGPDVPRLVIEQVNPFAATE